MQLRQALGLIVRPRVALTAALVAAAAAVLAPAAPAAAPHAAPLDPAFGRDIRSGAAFVHSSVTVEPGSAGVLPRLRAEALPSSYDLRNVGGAILVTAVRDQDPANTCWAFATMASLESHLLMAGETVDLSEDNMVTRSGFGPFSSGPYQYGGNYQMAAAYLARWSGPLVESDDPYLSKSSSPTRPVRKHVQGIVMLAPRQGDLDNDAIKAAVMAYGAVGTEMYYPEPDNAVFNEVTRAFYTAGGDRSNHAVAIVGWDDAFPAANFITPPPGDGAFLVRNSWGADWGDGGYFWISYYDATLARDDMSVAFSRVDPLGRYARAYGYDTFGWTRSIGTGSSTGSFANRFTARASDKLSAVSFYTSAPGATYTVYTGPSLRSMRAHGSGTLVDAGYATVPVSPRLGLTKGRRFVVAVRLTVPGDTVPIPVEKPIAGYAAATASSGQSFVKNGGHWVDLTTQRRFQQTNVCLRAFTRR